MMHKKIITQIRVSFSLNQHFLKWPQIPISATECYIFSLSSWLTIQLLGISTLLTFPYNCFFSFKTNKSHTCIFNFLFSIYFRYIESGCYRGFMQQVGKQLVSNNLSTPPHNLLWNVYTDTDFEFKNKQSKPKCTKLILLLAKFLLPYQLYLSVPTKLYIFNNYFFLTVGTSQMYKNLLETNSSSVMKQLDIIEKHLPNNYTGLVVHTLKSGGNPKSSKHRYISNMTILSMITSGHQNVQDDCRSSQFTLPTQLLLSFRYLYLTNNTRQNKEVWNDALHNYIVQGQLPPVTSNILQHVSTMDCNDIHDQLSLLSSIPNFHWWQYIRCDGKKSSSDICVNLIDHFLYHPTCEESDTFKLKYIPKSPRNRLMYYIYTDPLYAHSMKRLIHQLLRLDKKEDTPFPNSPDNNSHFLS